MHERTISRILSGIALGSLLLVGAGCAGKGTVTANVSTGAEGQGANPGTGEPNRGGNVPPAIGKMPVRKLVAIMGALNGSNQGGSAEITEENGKTTVTVMVTDEPAGATEPAHIHAGACPNPGDVVWSLNAIVDGKSVTTLDVPLADMIAKFPIAINVHKSSTDIATYQSCGNLSFPSDQPGAGADSGAAADMGTGADPGLDLQVNAGVMTAPREVRIAAKQFAFTPSEVRVKLGERIRLIAESEDVTHGLSIPAFNVNLTLEPGKPAIAEFVADQKGEFPFFCSTFCGSGHGGMHGTLIVE